MSRLEDRKVFHQPWEAQAFALVVALQDSAVFTAAEWAAALGAEVARAGGAPDGCDYYTDWVAALESLLADKGLATRAGIDDLAASWQRAAHGTPHGEPIELKNDPHRRPAAPAK